MLPENSWKHEPKAIFENKEVLLMYDLMIPSSVNIDKALRPNMELMYENEKRAWLSEVSVPSDFGLNNAEIKKVTKYHQDLKNEVKIYWKLKNGVIVPVIIGATGMIKKKRTSWRS